MNNTNTTEQTNNDSQDKPVTMQSEINNLMQVSQAFENFPMIGSNNMIGYASCVKSLNMTIGNLIKLNQNKGETLTE